MLHTWSIELTGILRLHTAITFNSLPSQSEIAEGYVLIRVYLFIYLFIYLYALFYSLNSKSIQPNRMTFGGMIGYYPHQ